MNTNEATQQRDVPTLGRYRILRRLGRGGMADVWLCEDPRLQRQVAVKTLPPHNQQDSEYIARFEREAQAAAALNHPHILPVHDYGRQPLAGGNIVPFIVMPYIVGGTLTEHIARYSQQHTLMSAQEALAFLSQAAEGIDYAHEQRIIHRDIKPGNMLLRDENWLLLADFGIARILGDDTQQTLTGSGFGTPEYMAPEQARGHAVLTSDNYSLAVLAYQLLTGHLPFQGDTAYATTIQHITMPPPSPRQFNAALNAAVEHVLLQGLAKQPAERPASARAFVMALQHAIDNQPFEALMVSAGPASLDYQEHTTPVVSATLPASPPVAQPALTRRHLVIAGGAVAAVAVGGVATWALSRNSLPSVVRDPNKPVLVLIGQNKPAHWLGWSPSADTLASAGDENRLLIWEVPQLIKGPRSSPLYAASQKFDTTIIRVAWSYDGRYLAVGAINNVTDPNAGPDSNQGSINVYTRDLKPAADHIPAIKTPEGFNANNLWWIQNRYLITVVPQINGNNQSQLMRMWDTTQPQLSLKPLLINAASPMMGTQTLAVSPGGFQVALGLGDGVTLGQVSVVNNEVRWQTHIDRLRLSQDNIAADGVSWGADGNTLVAYNETSKVITFWNLQEGQPQGHRLQLPDDVKGKNIHSLACNRRTPVASPYITVGFENGAVYLWKAAADSLPISKLDTHGIQANVMSLAWSNDGHYLAAGFADTNATILVWQF